MPDDDRRRRRLGDETKNRIADLASGWTLDGDANAPAVPAIPDHTPKPASTATPKPAAAMPSSNRAAAPSPPVPPAPARTKGRTNPPPPPGSAERKALEDGIVETASARVSPLPASNASGRVSAAQPSSGSGRITSEQSSSASGRITATAKPSAGEARAKPPSQPPAPPKSGPQFKRAGYAGPQAPFATESRTFSTEPRTPRVIVDESISDPVVVSPAPVPAQRSAPAAPASIAALPLPAPEASSIPGLAVPVGEFDSGVQTVEQATMKRESAEALPRLQTTPVEELLEPEEPEQRDDATMIDPQTHKFERGDPTQSAAPGGHDATEIQGAGMQMRHQSGGTLRPSAALRRKRGLAGDVRYVFTALFGVRASRRELAELEHRQSLRQTSRRRHLITLGRSAVITDSFDHPALGKGREQLQAIEDERSKHAGAVAASDAELERVRRDREAKAKQYVADLGATDAELAELAKKLEPLEKEAATARRRAQELRESLQRIEKKIADTEALLTSVRAEKLDKAGIQADIATYKADRHAVLRDEPVLAAELDALNPRIAAIESSRTELKKKRSELEKAEQEDQRRTAELLDAIGAKRKVVERAAADAETARDQALFELGDRLYVDRPKVLAAQLSPIDQIDLELGEGDRRIMELREIISNVDKAKLARGAAMIILALGAGGSLVAWLLYLLA